jgi:hypothetical protein
MPDLVTIVFILICRTKNYLSALNHCNHKLYREDALTNAKVSAEQRFHAEPG